MMPRIVRFPHPPRPQERKIRYQRERRERVLCFNLFRNRCKMVKLTFKIHKNK